MDITLGTTSSLKCDAVAKACRQLGIDVNLVSCKTTTSINKQPVGIFETYVGASLRAMQARDHNPGSVVIGIESGILHEKGEFTIDVACIVVIRADGSKIVTTSTGISFPEGLMIRAREIGFETTTVGSLIAQELGGAGDDPHAALTKKKVTRLETLVPGIVAALAQL